jgi:pimeloyl-ACP methyl ester carboxylesterase
VDTARIVLGGHSMGAFAAAQYAAAHDDIAALLLLDAWDVGADASAMRGNAAERARQVAGIDDLGNAVVGADPESLVSEVENGPADWELLNLASS